MSILEIRKWPNKSLATIAERVIDEPWEALVSDMIETMDSASGIGLAAPQVGVSKRIITLSKSIYNDCNDSNSKPEVMINPEILDGMGEITLTESCLSLPGPSFWTQRAHIICVRYEDDSRSVQEEIFSGLPAVVIQHECDHLDGVTLADKATSDMRRKVMAGETVSAV